MTGIIITTADKLDVECPHCNGTGRLRLKALDPQRVRARFDRHWLPDLKLDCWVWVASLNSAGYGMMSIGSRTDNSKRPALAHRIAYELFRGPIPSGLVLDHLCRNRYCVNPDHLELVAPFENVMRGSAPEILANRNLFKTHCPQGHPYSGKNLYRRPDGSRGCKACNAAARRRYVEKRNLP